LMTIGDNSYFHDKVISPAAAMATTGSGYSCS
jgi:hypothetical protein